MKERWIRNSGEYRIVYKEGIKRVGRNLIVYAYDHKGEKDRFGIAVSKRIGKAVVRNKIRRRLRAVIRNSLVKQENNVDWVFVARKAIVHASYQEILRECVVLTNKIKK